VCVLEDGTVYMYSMHGDKVSVFNLGPECKDSGVAGTFIFYAALTNTVVPLLFHCCSTVLTLSYTLITRLLTFVTLL
jgi:hypothetical protein